jgi:hypothetical protein
MRAAAHIRLLLLAAIVWLAFWIGGLPDYYQQYSFPAMTGFSVVLIALIVVLARRVLAHVKPIRRMVLAYWLSFYFTVPLMLLDYLYCGLYLGHGWDFIAGYWYLTAFYIVPWVILIPTAHLLSRPQATLQITSSDPPMHRSGTNRRADG